MEETGAVKHLDPVINLGRSLQVWLINEIITIICRDTMSWQVMIQQRKLFSLKYFRFEKLPAQ
jgi:hypothetical protein